MNKPLSRFLSASLITLLSLAPVRAQEAEVPHTITYQGRLTDTAGSPLSRTGLALTFTLYEGPATPDPIWTETQEVDVAGGVFTAHLGRTNPLPGGLDYGRGLYVAITVEGEPLEPRLPLGSVPHALAAGTAQTVADGSITPVKLSVANTPVDGQVLVYDAASGRFRYADLPTGDGGEAFSLPFSGSATQSAGTAFRVEQKGTGGTASFTNTNASSSATPLTVQTFGTGNLLEAYKGLKPVFRVGEAYGGTLRFQFGQAITEDYNSDGAPDQPGIVVTNDNERDSNRPGIVLRNTAGIVLDGGAIDFGGGLGLTRSSLWTSSPERGSSWLGFSVNNIHYAGIKARSHWKGLLVTSESSGLDVDAQKEYGATILGPDGTEGVDLILGGRGEAGFDDDGVLHGPFGNGGGDLVFRSHDAVTFYLDHQGASEPTEDADFEIKDRAGNLIFNVDDGGDVTADGTITGGGADLAEAFAVEGPKAAYEPGDVLVISTRTDRTVEKSTSPHSPLVAGVYATKPGVLLAEDAFGLGDDHVPLGVVGVIPTKVSAENGPIARGDLLVTSSTRGHAMKAGPNPAVGTVLGKALEPFDGAGTGRIRVLVSVR